MPLYFFLRRVWIAIRTNSTSLRRFCAPFASFFTTTMSFRLELTLIGRLEKPSACGPPPRFRFAETGEHDEHADLRQFTFVPYALVEREGYRSLRVLETCERIRPFSAVRENLPNDSFDRFHAL